MSAITGPRLSDRDFFDRCLDDARPELEEARQAADRGDLGAARRLFAAEARRCLQPERFFTVKRTYGGQSCLHPGESPGEAVERILAGELVSCGTAHRFEGEVDWTINPTHNQYKEWTWQLSRHPEWGILADRYRAAGDERCAEAVVRFFRSWVRQAVVPESAPGNETLCWRTIEAGIRMGGVWQHALHAFHRSPHFSDDVLVDWYKSVWEHGWRLRHFHRTHNWLIMEMNGLGQVALLYPMFREASEWRAYALARLEEELTLQVYPDGFQFELSTGYHQVVVRNIHWLMDLYAAYGAAVPASFAPALERMHEANVRLVMPDGRLPDLNDGSWLELAPAMERAVALAPQRSDFRWAATRGAEGAPPREASWAFPYAGYTIMRTGWQPDAIWVLFDGGPFGFAHQHEDKLNLLLHAYGRLLLTEGGNYAYDDSPMRRYVLSTRSHNTIRVDGCDQNRRLRTDREAADRAALIRRPAGGRWRAGERWDCVEAVYDEGYGPDGRADVAHERRVLLYKRPPAPLGPFVLVVDRLRVAHRGSHSYEALWHLGADRAISANATTVLTDDPDAANLAVVAASIASLSVSVVAGRNEPEFQGWKAVREHTQDPPVPAPAAVARWQSRGPVRLATLLYPLRPADRCPLEAIAAEPSVEAFTLRLSLRGGPSLELDERDFFETPCR